MEKWDMGLKAQSQKAAAKRGKEWRSYWWGQGNILC
jgi:hypothetical protein